MNTGPLARSFVRLHRSLICLLPTARFARALCCAHSFVRSLAHISHFLAREKVGILVSQSDQKTDGPTDQRTNGQTDQPTNIAAYRVACTRLKMKKRKVDKNHFHDKKENIQTGATKTFCLIQKKISLEANEGMAMSTYWHFPKF